MEKAAIEFTLIQNALDSVERVVELLAWRDVANEESRLKQAIMLTAHATELLLKERLRRVHPSLIWESVDSYPNLDARTVGVEKAIHRLRVIGNIVLSDQDAAAVKALRNTRNAIEHFQWRTTRAEVNGIVGHGLSFAIHFAKDQLGTDFAYRFRGDDTWDALLSQHGGFSRAHGERMSRLMQDQGQPVQECGHCHAMAQDLSTGACSLCGHWEDLGGPDEEPF